MKVEEIINNHFQSISSFPFFIFRGYLDYLGRAEVYDLDSVRVGPNTDHVFGLQEGVKCVRD